MRNHRLDSCKGKSDIAIPCSECHSSIHDDLSAFTNSIATWTHILSKPHGTSGRSMVERCGASASACDMQFQRLKGAQSCSKRPCESLTSPYVKRRRQRPGRQGANRQRRRWRDAQPAARGVRWQARHPHSGQSDAGAQRRLGTRVGVLPKVRRLHAPANACMMHMHDPPAIYACKTLRCCQLGAFSPADCGHRCLRRISKVSHISSFPLNNCMIMHAALVSMVSDVPPPPRRPSPQPLRSPPRPPTADRSHGAPGNEVRHDAVLHGRTRAGAASNGFLLAAEQIASCEQPCCGMQRHIEAPCSVPEIGSRHNANPCRARSYSCCGVPGCL